MRFKKVFSLLKSYRLQSEQNKKPVLLKFCNRFSKLPRTNRNRDH